jgi:PAS domain S-box-containing protein
MIRKNLLKILFVEDLPSDVELAVLELRKEKLKFEHVTVCTRVDLIKALKEFNPDLIISDYMMPAFNVLQALKEAKEFDPEIPFILYTGSVNEETAVECIKAGAQDYVIKEHMTRLPFAVKEALEQVRRNQENRASDLLLEENEQKLQSIFSAAPVGIGLVVDRVLIEMNDTFCTMTGYTRKELIGKSSEIIYSSSKEFINAGKEKYRQIKEKGIGSVETKIKRKDGKILNVLLSSAPLDKNDYSKGITFTVLDITERKKSEEALIESQHLFQTLAQVSPVGIFRTNRDGQTTYVNPKWLELSGLTFEEAMGFGWLKAVHPDDRKLLKGRWKSNVQTQRISTAEYRFLRSDGSIVWVMGNAVPEWINNKINGYIGTITDINDRKQAEDIINHERRMLRTLIDNVPDIIYVKDRECRRVIANISDVNNIGYNREEEILSKTDLDLFSGSIGQRGYNDDKEVINSGKPIINREENFITNTGEQRWHLISKLPLFNNKGEITGLVGIGRDITERILVEEELKKNQSQLMNALKIAHLGTWEHDIGNDLFIFNDLFYGIFRTTAEQVGGYTMKRADYVKRFCSS